MQAIVSSRGDCISDLVSLLLQFSSLDHDSQHEMEKISAASRVCLTSLLGILPAVDFVSSVSALVDSSDVKVSSALLQYIRADSDVATDARWRSKSFRRTTT
jgi:hypothetical protein